MLENKSSGDRPVTQVCLKSLRQVYGICYKNACIHLSNKKKLLGQFILPIMISLMYATRQANKNNPSDIAQSMILIVIMDLLLKIYIGVLGTTAIKELITIFIPERTQKFRQYQFIFGLNHQVYTIGNLFYMGLYFSLLILPFFLTICYYNFNFIYVFYFGSFVISQLTLTLCLTAFFTDHKIANQIIGMVFALSSFLIFFYQNDPEKARTFADYFAMIVPNSSFSIAIMYNNTNASVLSLFFAKIYFLVYCLVQYPQFFKQKCFSCCKTISAYIPLFQRQQTNLMQQFQLNEVVNSDIEQNSMFHQNKKIVIKTEGLVKTYSTNSGHFNALNGVNLKIHKSEIFGLLGRNGAGKTTLVDILTKIIKPTAGVFQIDNSKQTIGICYQHEILYELMTVEQHLYVYSLIKPVTFQNRSARNDHIENIIQMLNIDSQRRKQVKELSGGNKRKLSIAIAIIGNPQVLIFDEPTSGLDPLSRIYVWQILQKLRETQSTIILTTHHLDEAQKLSDWVCVIEKGAVIVENTAEQIKQRYGKGYHLSISTLNKLQKVSFQKIEEFKQIFQKNNLKWNELQQFNNQVNFLIKPSSKTMTSQQFQNNFIEIIEQLQRSVKYQFKFHSNTLQQSFIAIIKDSDNNSGDSLGQHFVKRRDHHQFQSRGCFFTIFYQFVGVFLKNMYYNKSNFTQSIILNNINIIVLLINIYFNKFMVEVIKENVPASSGQMGQIKQKQDSSAFALLQGYVIMGVAYIYTPVYQKQKKIRGVLNTRGLSWIVYWIGNFAFDFLIYNINLLILTYIVAPGLIASIGWFSLFKLGIGMILFAYCFSFMFDKIKTASVWFSLINIVLGMLIMSIIFVGKTTFLKYFSFLKFLYPYFDLTAVIIFQNQNLSDPNMANFIDIDKPEQEYIGITIIILVLVIMLLQISILKRIKQLFNRNQINLQIHEVIKLQNISKRYGSIEALKNVSYFANEERLALLGHNGAGKSTTFELLSAQLSQDQGNLYIQKQLHQSYNGVLKSTGICYQEDSLWQGILVNQILKIFSYIIPISGSKNQIQWLLQSLQYQPANLDKRFSALSGGNKRKLCMMVALFGDPLVRLLDQCSTGLDPSSRLAMVYTIKHSNRGTTIFTTHSMSQAEDLCSKSVIMSKGQVLQFDFISNLKNKYFDCCWVDIKVQQGDEQQKLKKIALKQLEAVGAKLVVDQRGSLRLQIIKKSGKISKMMRVLQALRAKRVIESYSNIQPKLEDVYLKVTRQQSQQIQSNQMLGDQTNPRNNTLEQNT